MISRMLRQWLLIGGLLLLALLLGMAVAWYNFESSTEFNGRYESSGSVVQKDGQVLAISHSMLIKDGRFYAVTRTDQTVFKTSGEVQSGFANHLRLRVEQGEMLALDRAGGLDHPLLFNLLYSSEAGSIINLRPSGPCYLAVETREIYCRSAGL